MTHDAQGKDPAAVELGRRGGLKGGKARAEALSSAELSEQASNAALARWSAPVATHDGVIALGRIEIACAVLSDGRRVLSQRSLHRALATGTPGKKRGSRSPTLPALLASPRLEPFISEELATTLKEPIRYRAKGHKGGGAIAHGVPAEVLLEVCDVWLAADEAGALHYRQAAIATRAAMLVRALARVGIVALVDEATGYQEVRDRLALQAILEKYLRAEFAAWAKRFPDEFYKHIFRLRSWTWKGMSVNRPQVVAHYTKDIIYQRLAPGILEELERRTPRDPNGRTRVRYHQFLTEDIGHPALAQHMHAVLGLMRSSDDWRDFMSRLNKAFPRKDARQLELL